MVEPEDLVQEFVAVWNERDPERRACTVRRLWSAEGQHLMGRHVVQGHAALEQRVLLSNQHNVVEKGYVFRPATLIQTLPGVIKFRWDMIRRVDGDVVSAGVGFLMLDEDGKITCDYLFTEA